MNERDFRYDAFISYRHAEPDRKWAKWLHRSLETYRIPKRLNRDVLFPGKASEPCVLENFQDEPPMFTWIIVSHKV